MLQYSTFVEDYIKQLFVCTSRKNVRSAAYTKATKLLKENIEKVLKCLCIPTYLYNNK